MENLLIINYGFVLFFGIILSLSFADIGMKGNLKLYGIILSVFGVIQIIAYLTIGQDAMHKAYPALVHFPLFLLLKYYFKRNTYIAGISVLSAYLFCTPRKWLGTLISSLWNYDVKVSYIIQIIITIPLLVIIILYISPYVARLKYESNSILRLFISIPLIYYVMEYILTVYTELLYLGGAALMEFMDTALVIVFYIFSIIYLKTLYEKKEIEIEQAVFKVLADESKAEIAALQESERSAAIYRHDLRHHLNYIYSCIMDNNIDDALKYISEVSDKISHTKVRRFSEDKSVNLILSSYARRAAEKEISLDINISTNDFSSFGISDLCSLLSNALENAINACQDIPDSNKRFIKLRLYSKNSKLCIEVRNTYQTEPVFKDGMPVSNIQGHGFGTKSMAYIIEKYNGICKFSAENGFFIFQATT